MVKPMLASSAQVIPEGDPNIVMEPKFDGWRAILDLRKDEGKAPTLHTRTGKAIDSAPYILEAFHNLLPDSTLDGEIVDLVGEPGRQWNRTQELLSRKSAHVPSAEDPPLTYVVFDMLELNGQSLLRRPLSERRQLLEALVALMPEDAPVQISPQFPANEEGFDRLVSAGWEGVVCKRLDAAYSPGARGAAWTKIKPEQEMDVVVTGTFPPAPGSKFDGSAVGGFTFEVTHNEGTLINRKVNGKCGTGMDNPLREDLLVNEAHYVGKVAVVGHAGIAPDSGALRFPSLIRFRDDADKSATDVRAVLNDEAGSTKINLLNRALQAEEERDEYRDKWEDARDRLAGAVKKGVASGKGSRGPRTGGYKRNYGAMGETKLVVAIAELRQMTGDAYDRVIEREGDPHAELVRAEENARGRGIAI